MTGLHDAAIAMMVIALAGNLGLNVIAVGVEAEGHRDLLADPGCLSHQCHPFNRPLPIEEFEQFSKRACDTSLPLLVTALERPVLEISTAGLCIQVAVAVEIGTFRAAARVDTYPPVDSQNTSAGGHPTNLNSC